MSALAAGGTVEAVAGLAGVSERTVHRRLAEPDFRRQVTAARDEMVARSVARLSATSTLAADCLRELLKARSETVRLGAARAVIELGARLREQEDLAERVRALEERLGESGNRKEAPTWHRTA